MRACGNVRMRESVHVCHLMYNVMIVMKILNIDPRAIIELTSLAFRASMLTITPPKLPGMSSGYPRLPVYAAPCLGGQCRLIYTYIYMYIITTCVNV